MVQYQGIMIIYRNVRCIVYITTFYTLQIYEMYIYMYCVCIVVLLDIFGLLNRRQEGREDDSHDMNDCEMDNCFQQ